MIIASVKYGNKRIGRYGITKYTCIADANNKLQVYLGDDIYYANNFYFDYEDFLLKRKNYQRCEVFKIID